MCQSLINQQIVCIHASSATLQKGTCEVYDQKNELQINVTQEFFQHERKDLALSNPQWMSS
jgi:hypothetical protein